MGQWQDAAARILHDSSACRASDRPLAMPESIFGTRSTDKVTTVRNPRYTVQYVQSTVLRRITTNKFNEGPCHIVGVGVGKSVRALSPKAIGTRGWLIYNGHCL